MAVYAKRPGTDTWHFCGNCSNYPKGTGTVTQSTKPSSGEFCNECRAKQASANCK